MFVAPAKQTIFPFVGCPEPNAGASSSFYSGRIVLQNFLLVQEANRREILVLEKRCRKSLISDARRLGLYGGSSVSKCTSAAVSERSDADRLSRLPEVNKQRSPRQVQAAPLVRGVGKQPTIVTEKDVQNIVSRLTAPKVTPRAPYVQYPMSSHSRLGTAYSSLCESILQYASTIPPPPDAAQQPGIDSTEPQPSSTRTDQYGGVVWCEQHLLATSYTIRTESEFAGVASPSNDEEEPLVPPPSDNIKTVCEIMSKEAMQRQQKREQAAMRSGQGHHNNGGYLVLQKKKSSSARPAAETDIVLSDPNDGDDDVISILQVKSPRHRSLGPLVRASPTHASSPTGSRKSADEEYLFQQYLRRIENKVKTMSNTHLTTLHSPSFSNKDSDSNPLSSPRT